MADGSIQNTATSTIQFIDSIDNLFDLFNSRMKIKPQEEEIESDDESEPTGAKRFCLTMFNFFFKCKYTKI